MRSEPRASKAHAEIAVFAGLGGGQLGARAEQEEAGHVLPQGIFGWAMGRTGVGTKEYAAMKLTLYLLFGSAFIIVGIPLIAAAWFAGPARLAVRGRRAIAPFLREQPALTFAIVGLISGTVIFRNWSHRLAPSTRAAS